MTKLTLRKKMILYDCSVFNLAKQKSCKAVKLPPKSVEEIIMTVWYFYCLVFVRITNR